jgi:hypothetical protein
MKTNAKDENKINNNNQPIDNSKMSNSHYEFLLVLCRR